MAASDSNSVVTENPAPRFSLRGLGIVALNGWLVFHLFAIVICPASVEPSSPLVRSAFSLVAPYVQTLFLDHGFRFFGPEPGPSTLVAYELTFPDGSTRSGRFPNRSIVPRLYYHRHFMLSEFLGNGPEELQPLVERAFARNLCRETGAVRVQLTRVVHEIPSIDDIRAGRSLNDPSFFKETPLGSYTPTELSTPFDFKPAEISPEEMSDSPQDAASSSEPSKDAR